MDKEILGWKNILIGDEYWELCPREIAILRKRLASIEHVQMILDVTVGEYHLRAIVNCGAKGNFMSKRLAAALQFATIVK